MYANDAEVLEINLAHLVTTKKTSESLSGRRYSPASTQLYNEGMAEVYPLKPILSSENRVYQLPSTLCNPWILCSHPRIPSGPSAPDGT